MTNQFHLVERLVNRNGISGMVFFADDLTGFIAGLVFIPALPWQVYLC